MRSRARMIRVSLLLIALLSIGFSLPAAATIKEGDLLVLVRGYGPNPLPPTIYRVDPDDGTWEPVLPLSLLPAPDDFISMVAGPQGSLYLLRRPRDRSIISVDLESGEYDVIDIGDIKPFRLILDARGDFIIAGLVDRRTISGITLEEGAVAHFDRSTSEVTVITDEPISVSGKVFFGADACGDYIVNRTRVSASHGDLRTLASEHAVSLQGGAVGINSSGEVVVVSRPQFRASIVVPSILYTMDHTTGVTEVVSVIDDKLSERILAQRNLAIGNDGAIFLTGSNVEGLYGSLANAIIRIDPGTGDATIVTTFDSTVILQMVVVPRATESRAERRNREKVCRAIRTQLFWDHMKAFSGKSRWARKR